MSFRSCFSAQPRRSRRSLAVVAHTGAISVVQSFFVMPLNYARGSMSPPTTLAAFVPMLEIGTAPVVFLSTVDIFVVWRVFLLGMDLAVVTKRQTAPIAIALFAVYGVVAVVITVVRTQMGS
jgi:hypothetical protein